MRETQQVSKWRLVYIVMAAEFDGKSGIATLQDLHLYSYALCNVAEELINTEYRGIVIEARDSLVISFEDEDGESNLLRALADSEMVKSYVEEQFKQTISIGLGRMTQNLGALQHSYHDALSALSYKMILHLMTIRPDLIDT